MILPKTRHLKVMMYLSSLSGTWPFIFENNPTLKKLYNIYSNIICYFFSLYILCAVINLYILITDDVVNISEVVANLGISLLDTIAVLRLRALNSQGIKNIVRKVIIFEEKVLKCDDENIIKIYESHTKQNQITNVFFIANIISGCILFLTYPLTVPNTIISNPTTNDTVIIKPLPFTVWLPFDEQMYYYCAYIFYGVNTSIASLLIATTDIYACSLLIFFLGQIKILKHILTDFQNNVVKVKNQLQCTRDEASFVTMRECILKHKEIIQYVQQYNNEMRTAMLLDFLQSSIQLASTVVLFFMRDDVLMSKTNIALFAYAMFYRLFVYYWYANEITEHSSEIGTALYISKWYEEPIKVQKMMVVMIMRCNRPLCLQIGMFGTMTLTTFIGVLKATYSYMMLVYE